MISTVCETIIVIFHHIFSFISSFFYSNFLDEWTPIDGHNEKQNKKKTYDMKQQTV